MSQVLQDLSAPALVTAIEENMFAIWRFLHHWPQIEVHDDPDMLWTITNIPFAAFNAVLRAQLRAEKVDAAIEAAIDRCRSRHVPMLWRTGPVTRPANLGPCLERRGFSHTADLAGMAVDLSGLNESVSTPLGLVVEQVSDAETLKHWCRAATAGFGWPDFATSAFFDSFTSLGFDPHLPLRNYIGWLEGEPVATSTLFLAAGVAGIYCVATLPQARRKRIGTAMTLAPLRTARALGYRVGILQASEMGFGVYHRIGFREYCKIGHYEWTSETEQSGETTDAA